MINLHELRQGSVIHFTPSGTSSEGRPCIVKEIHSDHAIVSDITKGNLDLGVFEKDLYPIPLTTERLIEIGFLPVRLPGSSKDWWQVIKPSREKINFLYSDSDDIILDHFHTPVRTLHQLQNLLWDICSINPVIKL